MTTMKKIGLLTLLVVLLGACRDKVINEYYMYEPVYTDYESFREPAQMTGSKAISSVGQLYTKDGYLFIVENDNGFHIIDNTSPSNPVNVGFVELTGCTGISIRGNYLMANSFIDLVVFDVSNMSNPTEVNRIEDVFPFALPITDKNYPHEDIDKNKGVVTSWNTIKRKEEVDPDTYFSWNNCWNCQFETMDGPGVMFDATTSTASTSSSSVGVAGSIAKFTIVGDYLYVMDGWQLIPFNLNDPSSPVASTGVGVWGDVETLFPYKNYIFMGTPSGMLVYGTDNPENPNYLSSMSHARGCDPVVVEDDFAYVTVRSGGPCGGTINQLDVIDISDVTYPQLIDSYEMKNPHGLGIENGVLMVCDGKDGLKVFDASTPADCGKNKIDQFKNIQATDVIMLGGIAMMIGDDGLYQYDYSDLHNIELLSKINF